MKILLISIFLFLISGCSFFRSWDFECLDICDSNDEIKLSSYEGKNIKRRCVCVEND